MTKVKTIHPSSPLVSYVSGIVLLAVVVCGLLLIASPRPDAISVMAWTGAFLAAELMVFRTPTGKGSISMAATLHLASLPFVGAPVLIPAVWVSRMVANLIIQKQPWYKAVFNAAQVSLVVLAASYCYMRLGGSSALAITGDSLPRLLPAFVAASAVYYLINTALVCGVIAISTSSEFWVTWKENWGYRVEAVSSAALFLLAPVAAHAYQDMGMFGLVVFLLPMLFIRDACKRFIVLERTQRALIGSERLAAKGEMAASIGHELNNYLGVVHGNLQLLEIGAHKLPEKTTERLQTIAGQIRNMTQLSKGLMDFSHLESRIMLTDLSSLVTQTADLLRPQNRFDGIQISVECDPRVGMLEVDPAQIQQVLMNLLNNSADAMREANSSRRKIGISLSWRASDAEAELTVQDSGPGIPEEQRRQIFEPTFTTREAGHGFGLSTVFRIVNNHKGSIKVEDAPTGGALFRILLPTGASARNPLAA